VYSVLYAGRSVRIFYATICGNTRTGAKENSTKEERSKLYSNTPFGKDKNFSASHKSYMASVFAFDKTEGGEMN
jgi:hypothetical protein